MSPRAISVALKVALHRVERLIPFLQEQPFSMYPDPRNLESDPVFQKYYRFPDPSHIPGSLLVYEKAFGDRRDTLSSLDWTSFGLPGLALCSRDIRPLEGVFGEILSAMELLEVWKKQDKIPGKARPKRRGVQRSGASAP